MTHRWAAPTALDDALAVLTADAAARPVAGGTDLVVAARQGRRSLPDSIVAIDRIPELAGQRLDDDGALLLGALTSHAWLASAGEVRRGWTALADAAAIVGSPATRGTGTLGGNVMNASPAADTVGPLIVAGALATLRSSEAGPREIAVADLATGPGATTARADELLTHVRIPPLPAGSGSAYVRLEYRAAMEIAVVGATAVVVLGGRTEGSSGIREARIALTAVAPTIIRAPGAEALLVGRAVDGAAFGEAGDAAAQDASPISDVRASADYRRAMIRVVVARALGAAARRAAGEPIPVPASRWAHGQEA
jgi:CO/xanthine dehydrogenase FAD-binding subunit